VDSSDVAFQIAGSMAIKEAARQAGLVLLEPMMDVEVIAPEQYLGSVIGDLSARRGQITETDTRSASVQAIKSLVPLAQMFGYVRELRSMTQGRATYSMELDSYREVPQSIAEELISGPVTQGA
jgi:elongation factor G